MCVPAKLNLMMCGAPPRTIAVQFELASLLPECAGKTMFYEMRNKPEEREGIKDKQEEHTQASTEKKIQ